MARRDTDTTLFSKSMANFFWNRAGVIALVETLPTIKVYPSGFERAISSIARMPNAPGLLSTTNCWPRICRICSPNRREVMSVAPPGAYGTTIFTGFEGYLSCAEAVPAQRASPSNARPKPNRFITSSLYTLIDRPTMWAPSHRL